MPSHGTATSGTARPRNKSIGGFPCFAVRDDNSMRFDLQSFDRPVTNSSGEFDYYRNNTARLNTASQISGERQVRPAAVNHEPVDELVVVPAPGAVMLFSGAQLHSSIANRSGRARFSVDFRTVDVADLQCGPRCSIGGRRLHRHRHSRFPQSRGRSALRRGVR